LGKLKIFSGKELCKLLLKYGFMEKRRKGSHIVMQLKTEKGTITVLVPDHSELKAGTLASIIRQSGLARSIFEVE
jgi:predicted RNA binding protein YcfA (HicA-like mRNA interferase family)